MTATPGTWSVPDEKLTISYRWSATGKCFATRPRPTYTPSITEFGTTLSVTVAASAPGYTTARVR